MTRDFRLIVLTPAGFLDPALAIAANRAGEFGVLDLEYAPDDQAARQAAARLALFAHNPYGLKLNCAQADLLSTLVANAPEHLSHILLTGRAPELLRPEVEFIHQKGRQVLLEATCLDEARLGAALGVDGLIAKGHEAGGYVGEETTFVLLQRFLKRLSLPIYAQGGIGLHTAAACYIAGAAGVVLEAQLALTRESRLPASIKDRLAAMDGSETVCLGGELGEGFRIYFRPGLSAVEALRREEEALVNARLTVDEKRAAWRKGVGQRVCTADPSQSIWLLGQAAAFAAPLARRFITVSGVLSALRTSIDTHCETAHRLRPLDQGAPLARSHGTRYPIVQGPMTRVSDNPAFALEVAKAGGLPFLALALTRKADVVSLLEATRQQLGERPWGVGILGFVPPDVRQEQLEAIRLVRPAFALIAGGRPDQASLLEQEGIPTYIHVPSPGLLRIFLAQGSRRFVFEGRECGGHVGPRSSFVLWEAMIDVLLEHLAASPEKAQDCHVLFAGGIHDAASAAMVAVLAAPLADLGVRLGVLMGTAYLFTREAVTSGAIVPAYQAEALRSEQTVLVESGPGHATRCLPTPFTQTFAEHKRRFLQEKFTGDRLREALEALNLGRLRIATKGMTRHPRYGQDPAAPKYLRLDEAEQREQGMYMIGQVAALRDEVCSLEALHQEVSVHGSARLAAWVESKTGPLVRPEVTEPSRIAIVGMACLLPGATHWQTYWENILNKSDAVSEVPHDRWDWKRYFDPDQSARDKIYSRWGGFIQEIPFNPLDYGMPPNAVTSIEPLQLLMLEVVRAGLADAGYRERPFPRERTSVIVGAGGGLGDLGYLYGFRAYLPHFLDPSSSDVIARLSEALPEWTEDSFPGILLNVVAGRIANRFDLGGPNFTVDAACASSLAALDVAIKDLESRRTDMAIVGAGDTVQSPFAFLAFSKTQALSPSGRCRPFDANADGIAISEGLAVVVLKRLEDAERDGDRIYAVVQGVGASSDGKDKGLTAPRPAGQLRAMRRAYAKAGFPPESVGLIEAHGTGTRVGDLVEVEALCELFRSGHVRRQSCALGSVKSMIGHTKSTAGLAGLIKAALALYHQTLPPTLVDQPNPKINFPETPFYVNHETRPWLTGAADQVRRAGVSAFGFGGTNAHAVLEEYRGGYAPDRASRLTWPAELLIWRGPDHAGLVSEINKLENWLRAGYEPPLRDLAYSAYLSLRQSLETGPSAGPVLAIVATSLEDLKQKLGRARVKLMSGEAALRDPAGIYFSAQPLGRAGKTAFVFPGQGSQYPNMLRDLALQFPQVRACFEQANHTLRDDLPRPLSDYIFPLPAYAEEEAQANRQALTSTRVAQPALGAADLAVSGLLKSLGVRPDIVAGHSYGELVALCEAGVIGERDLFIASEARGRFMAEAAGPESGTMAAVTAGRDVVAAELAGASKLTLANLNAPNQTVISGPRVEVEAAVKRFQAQGVRAQVLPVACAFHSPLVAAAGERLAQFLETLDIGVPALDVFSNSTAQPYPRASHAIREILSSHIVRPVEFQREVEAMYAAGARVFVEAGPHNVVSGLVGQILADRPHLAIPIDQPGGSGLLALQKALGQLAAAGAALSLEPLYEGRDVSRLDFSRPYESADRARLGSTTWLVSGGRARRWADGNNNVPEATTIPLAVRLADGRMEASAQSSTVDPLEAETSQARPSEAGATAMSSPAVSTTPQSSEGAGDHENEVTQVVLQHQQLMSRFLEIQKNVMLAYLGGASTLPPPSADEQKHVSAVTVQPLIPSTAPITVPTHPDSAQPSETTEKPAPPDSRPNREPPPARHETLPEKEGLTQELLAIVSERTGYPPEMLKLDADLEADLGIDSIKRVEVLGTLRMRHSELAACMSGQGMEQLQAQRTLRAIADWIHSRRGRPEGPPALEAASQANLASVASLVPSAPILRFTLAPAEAPLNGTRARLAPDRVILITDDEQDIGRAVADALRRQGYKAIRVASGQEAKKTDANAFVADLTRSESVFDLVDAIRRENGPIGSLLHLIPLRSRPVPEALEFDRWRNCVRQEVFSLFHLIRALHEDLASAAQAGGACVLAATDMGEAIAHNGHREPTTFCPSRGGLAGLLKTAAHELPTVRTKVVDLNMRHDLSLAVQAILQELTAGDGLIEVGYDGASRKTLRMRPSPLHSDEAPAIALDPQSVILATGGARGITAQVAEELALRYQPTLVLVGRSPLPAPEESPRTSDLTSPRAIKEALIASRSQEGQNVSIAEVEAAYHQLLHEREIRASLQALQRAGATVRYYQVDVRDEVAFGALIDDLYRTYGRLDGVIHGAGIIEDKLIQDKTPASFERVVGTKVDSAFVLSRKLRPDSLKFLAFFSSVSGRFGNRGQSDYAAANEVLNKLARYLDQRWPARVVSINWGPWDATGMVSPEVRQEFQRRGISLIPAATGRQRLIEELTLGRKGEAEVIICGEDAQVMERP